jgi:hypothetical protein
MTNMLCQFPLLSHDTCGRSDERAMLIRQASGREVTDVLGHIKYSNLLNIGTI